METAIVIAPDMLVKYGVDLTEIERIRAECASKTFDTPANYRDGTQALALARKTRVGIEKRRVELKAESNVRLSIFRLKISKPQERGRDEMVC